MKHTMRNEVNAGIMREQIEGHKRLYQTIIDQAELDGATDFLDSAICEALREIIRD